jgi:predicted RNA-binding Zn-ribbon protein involved in translation (DUF1610 family)
MICPHCGKEHAGRAASCPITGKPILAPAEITVPVMGAVEVGQDVSSSGKTGDIFPSISESVASAQLTVPATITCPWCGKEHPARALFCPATNKAMPDRPLSGPSRLPSPIPGVKFSSEEQRRVVEIPVTVETGVHEGSAPLVEPTIEDLQVTPEASSAVILTENGIDPEKNTHENQKPTSEAEPRKTPHSHTEMLFPQPDMDDLATAARVRMSLRNERGFFSQIPRPAARLFVIMAVLVVLLVIAQGWSILRIIQLETILQENNILIKQFQQIVTDLMVKVQSLPLAP